METDNRRVIIHPEPHPANQGKHGRLRMLTTTKTEIHYWPCPYIDQQIAADKYKARKQINPHGMKQSRLSKLEKIAIERGGSVTDLPNRKQRSGK